MRTTNEQTSITFPGSRHEISEEIVPKLRLHPNDVVKCRVMRSVPPNYAVLSINGKEITAETKIPLRENEVVTLQVRQVSPRLVLEAVKPTGYNLSEVNGVNRFDVQGFPYRCILDLLESLFAGNEKVAGRTSPQEIVAIRRVFEAIALIPGQEKSPEIVESALRDSGMFWEEKLKTLLSSAGRSLLQGKTVLENDLKGVALAALSNLSDREASAGVSLRGFLDGLEQLQLLNVSALEDKGKCLFVLPVRFNDEYRFAQLLIDLRTRARESRKRPMSEMSYRVCLLLDMTALGPIHVEASVLDKALRIYFLVGDEGIRELFTAATDHLTETLERHGFSVQQMVCRCTNCEEMITMSLVDEILDPERHQISLIV